jgi:beta-galactosidase
MKIINYRVPYFFFIALSLPLVHYGQRTEYSAVFAPADRLVQSAGKPYRDDLCLNGLWQFQPMALPAGFKEGIDPTPALADLNDNAWEKTPIRIPSPWNVNSFANKDGQGGDFRCYPSYPLAWENCKMGWLKKKFTVPAGWKGRRIQLHFEAVAGDAVIMVNGKKAGTHFGIFLPFDLDITDAIMFGKENELCVGVRKASLFDHRSEYGRRTYQAGSFWGQHIAGIWQDVYAVALPMLHISNVFIQPRVNADTLQAELTIVNEKAEDAIVSLDAMATAWKTNGPVALQLPAKTIKIPAHGEAKIMLATAVNGKLKYWSTETPALYNLVVQVREKGKLTDTKSTRFGWRQVTLEGNKVLLNGKAITMRGDSWHFLGIPQMTRRYAQAWYQAMRDAKINAVRLHAQPYPSFYLDVADEMGILVLDETAMWASDGGPKLNEPLYWADSKQHLSELILRDRNHPSVFGWSVSNEIMPIVRGVMHNPPGMKDTLVKYYGEWAGICRLLDPTRQWISADGEDDGEGRLPVYIVHYGGTDAMNRAQKNGRPWGVGEAGMAYYGTPAQVAETNGMRAYESFEGRMEGVAASSYQSLIAQRDRNAIYQSVFNMVWYGLRPLPLGLKDTTRAPDINDGVYFTHFKEGEPGVQPERLGPYCTTLNPGYDPSLPLYRTWPLFDAIRDAGSAGVVSRWMAPKPVPAKPLVLSPVASVQVLAGTNSTLATSLQQAGVVFEKYEAAKLPALLLIDGTNLPVAPDRTLIEKITANGGTVVVWGVQPGNLPVLNELLPAKLELHARKIASLVTEIPDTITTGITAADLYFSEMRPPEITEQAMAGALVKQSQVLLKACETDWLKWNKQPEYAKTGMVVRSELETKPASAVMIKKTMGKGTLIVTTLPAAPRVDKAEKAMRLLLANMGVSLADSSFAGKPVLKSGELTIDLSKAKKEGSVTSQDFWVLSPRSLDDLLIEPNIPVVNMEVTTSNGIQVWLNDKQIINTTQAGKATAGTLRLHQGWNHFQIRISGNVENGSFSGRLTCNQPAFLKELESVFEKP